MSEQKLKLKNGKEVEVVGEIAIGGRKHFIVASHGIYVYDVLCKYLVIPSNEFDINHGEWCEVVNNESVDAGIVPETNSSKTGEVEAENPA